MTRMILIALVVGSAGLAAAEVAKPPPPPVQGPVGTPTSQPPTHTKPRADEPFDGAGGAGFAPRMRRPPPAVTVHPAPEIAKLGKEIAGTYKCKGVSLRGDGSSRPLQTTATIKLDLDSAWIQTAFVDDAPAAMKSIDYRTYDATAKQWTRIQLASTSGHVVSTSLGEKDGKWMWEGTETSPSGTQQVRDYEQRDAKQLKIWGEALLSGSWQKLYEATCKK